MFSERIKFRGKDRLGKWMYGYFNMVGDKAVIYDLKTGIGHIAVTNTISQWCPDTSCLGRVYGDIYCGDIVRYFERHDRDPDTTGLAIILDDTTIIEDGCGRWWHPQDTLQYEVVGNVWDDFDILSERSQNWVAHYVFN